MRHQLNCCISSQMQRFSHRWPECQSKMTILKPKKTPTHEGGAGIVCKDRRAGGSHRRRRVRRTARECRTLHRVQPGAVRSSTVHQAWCSPISVCSGGFRHCQPGSCLSNPARALLRGEPGAAIAVPATCASLRRATCIMRLRSVTRSSPASSEIAMVCICFA